MENIPIKISSSLQIAYDEMYSDKDAEWRELCGKYKAENVSLVCRGQYFSNVLECGAGEGSILKFLDAINFCNKLYAIEISDSGIKQIKKRNLKKLKEVKKFDGYSIPYEDKKFDMVFCAHVLEHVEHPRILLREIKRVSTYQVFEIPLDYSTKVDNNYKHLTSYGHINVFTPSLFKFLLKSEGFEIISERYTYISADVMRHIWYKNMGIKKSWFTELRVRLLPVSRFIKNVKFLHLHKEIGCSAYTCLVKGSSELRVF